MSDASGRCAGFCSRSFSGAPYRTIGLYVFPAKNDRNAMTRFSDTMLMLAKSHVDDTR